MIYLHGRHCSMALIILHKNRIANKKTVGPTKTPKACDNHPEVFTPVSYGTFNKPMGKSLCIQ